MKNKIKTIIAFTVLFTVCAVAIIFDLNDKTCDVYPTDDTQIMLYGESHGAKEYYDVELKLWKDCYVDGLRDLFVELPYYSAEFLNVWMKETSDDLIDTWFEEISGTLSGNRFFYDFLCEIKSACPGTTFYGTDVGHQCDTTGERYLKYLEDNGQKSSKNYRLAEECIEQGKSYYESDASYDGKSELREAFMVANFKAAYLRQGGGKIMGIYGSYHTDLSNDAVMAARLKADLGDVISSVKISSVMIWQKNPYALGLSVSGLLLLIMMFVPNILWAYANKPKEIEEAQKKENKILLIFERVGEVLVTASLLVFTSLNPVITKLPDGIYFRWNIVLWLVALILMILYECYWIKYFKSERTPRDMYSSFAGFPVAGATLPVLAVFILGIYSRNLVVIISAVVLGIGHIGIHLEHKKESVVAIENEFLTDLKN